MIDLKIKENKDRSQNKLWSYYLIKLVIENVEFLFEFDVIYKENKPVIVVEAKGKSGTLNTVDFALEQGKDVFVVPGNITSTNSTGTNELIKQGASCVTGVEDILK